MATKWGGTVGIAHSSISETHRSFIEAQDMFFVATAPTATDERVNLSPKAYGKLGVFGPNLVAYQDLTGSGNETAAHLLDNGRITIMLFAIDGDPLILRLYGYGRMVRPGDGDWIEWSKRFDPQPGRRQVMVMDVEEVREACGFMVPVYEKVRDREELIEWATDLGEDQLEEYREVENLTSIDGLPTGLREPDQKFRRHGA